MTREDTRNGGEGDGDGKNGARKSVKRRDSRKVHKRPRPQNKSGQAKTNNGESIRNNSVRKSHATSLTKEGDTNFAVGSRKRKRSREDFTHKTHTDPSIEAAMSETQPCIEVAMPDIESCIEVAMPDTKPCIEVAMPDTESCIEVAMPDTKPSIEVGCPTIKKRRVGHEPTSKQLQRRQNNNGSKSKPDTKKGEGDSEMPDAENHQDNLNIEEEQGDFTFQPPTC
ncbi:hypothetical protein H9L39_07994 [Fusarium oxysporum f. sp. albedinis]|nr:hypothetical protein H9L39_07994 [Fusarium oxysporum f. sp. albedinis]